MPASAQAVLASIEEYESDLDYEEVDESQTQTFQSCQSRTVREKLDVASVANLSDVQTESQQARVTGYRRPTEVKLPRFPKFNQLAQFVAKVGRNLHALSQFTDKAEISWISEIWRNLLTQVNHVLTY